MRRARADRDGGRRLRHGAERGPALSLQLGPLDPFSAAATALLAASDDYMAARYPAESNHLEPAARLARPGVLLLGAWQDGVLLGCGAVRRCRHDTDYGELKRMFVWPEARGLGAGRALLAALEHHLLGQGIALARLEMGIHQPEASALYARAGYLPRPPFGDYRIDPLSVFLEKPLQAPRPSACSTKA